MVIGTLALDRYLLHSVQRRGLWPVGRWVPRQFPSCTKCNNPLYQHYIIRFVTQMCARPLNKIFVDEIY